MLKRKRAITHVNDCHLIGVLTQVRISNIFKKTHGLELKEFTTFKVKTHRTL